MTTRRRWLTIALPVALLLIKTASYGAALFGPGYRGIGDLASLTAVLALLSLLAAAALMAGHRIGWLLALTFVGWELATSLVLWWNGQPEYLSMGLTAAAAVLLTSPEMRALHDAEAEA